VILSNTVLISTPFWSPMLR